MIHFYSIKLKELLFTLGRTGGEVEATFTHKVFLEFFQDDFPSVPYFFMTS